MLGLKLSSFWLKAFVPAGELKDIAMDATCKRIGTLPQDCTALDCSFPVFSLPALISRCLNLPDGTQENSEKVREAEGSLYRKDLCGVLWTPKKSCSVSFRGPGGDGSGHLLLK